MMSANGFRLSKNLQTEPAFCATQAPWHTGKSRGLPQGLLQVAPSRRLFQTRGIGYQQSGKLMGDPIARRPADRRAGSR
jgi:hypothetical protein